MPPVLQADAFDLPDAVDQQLEKHAAELQTLFEFKSEHELQIEIHRRIASGDASKHVIDGFIHLILSTNDTERRDLYFSFLAQSPRASRLYLVERLRHYSGALNARLKYPTAMIWFTEKLIEIKAPSVELIVLDLLKNASRLLEVPLVSMLQRQQDWAVQYHGIIATSVYVFLRPNMAAESKEFCLFLLQECWKECCFIGRDLVRLLATVNMLEDFPEALQLLSSPTPSYFLHARLPVELELNLKFVLEQVCWGTNEDIYVQWILEGIHLHTDMPDIIRFLVGAAYALTVTARPPIPRYALIGKLLKAFGTDIPRDVKVALFFDWIGFDPAKDAIFVLEPGFFLMEKSAEKFPAITQWCLAFMQYMADEFHPASSVAFRKHIAMAFRSLKDASLLQSMDRFDAGSQQMLQDLMASVPEDTEASPVEIVAEFSPPEEVEEEEVKPHVPAVLPKRRPSSPLWMFGDMFEDLKKQLQADQLAEAEAELKDIVTVYNRMRPEDSDFVPALVEALKAYSGTELGPLQVLLENKMWPVLKQVDGIGFKVLVYCLQHGLNVNVYQKVIASTDQIPLDVDAVLQLDTELLYKLVMGLFESLPQEFEGYMALQAIIFTSMDSKTCAKLMQSIRGGALRMFDIFKLNVLDTIEWDTFAQYHFWLLMAAEITNSNDIQTILESVTVEIQSFRERSELHIGLMNLLRSCPAVEQDWAHLFEDE